MYNEFTQWDAEGELGIIALSSCAEFGKKVDFHIREARAKLGLSSPETYLIPVNEVRFSNGEGKVHISKSVRGRNIFIMCDTGNYSCTYEMYGFTTHMGPDEHFTDLKRTISAICGKAKRISVIMPLMYASRQDRRKSRESLDCANALQELEAMGVKDIVTFDLHDSRVQNAVPLCSFENLYATYEMVRSFMLDEKETVIEKDNLLVISPDSGGMDRAIYYSNVLESDIGMFYKRRDLSTVVNGKNPIIQHEYMGQPVQGKNVLVIDDVIASGESILDIVEELKRRKVSKIFIATTFARFTEGFEKFNEAYEKGLINKVYSTNLTYVPKAISSLPWYQEVDMSQYLALFIDRLDHSKSIAPLIDATTTLREDIQKLRKS